MCMIDLADESYVIHNARMIVARKEHRCGECRRTIAVGEIYEYVTALAPGNSWDRWKTCEHCVWARQWLRNECNGWLYEMVYEDLKEHWDEEVLLRNLDLGRRIVGMRRRWQGFDGQLMRLEALA